MQSKDGKFHKTDVADTEQLLRLIQSIPSPKVAGLANLEGNKSIYIWLIIKEMVGY